MSKILKDRIPVLDNLRAFAALSVCLYHFVCTTTGYIKSDWILNIFSFGKSGVQLFFVISGFIIPWSMYAAKYKLSNFITFMVKRLVRLEPPYIISFLVATTVLLLREYLLGANENLQEISITRVILHFGYLIPFFNQYEWINQVYWTLAIEFQYYLLIAILFIPLVNGGLISRICIYIVMLLCGFHQGSGFLPHWLPVFLLGILTFLYSVDKIGKVEFYGFLILSFSFCVFYYKLDEVMYMIIPVLMILYGSKIDFYIGNWLGKMSYSLYLIHPVIGASLINVLSHHIQHPLGKFLLITLGLIVSILSAWLMYRFIEKPSKKVSASLKYRSP